MSRLQTRLRRKMDLPKTKSVKRFFKHLEDLPSKILKQHGSFKQAQTIIFYLPGYVPELDLVKDYIKRADECHFFSKPARLIPEYESIKTIGQKKQKFLYTVWPVSSASTLGPNSSGINHSYSSSTDGSNSRSTDFCNLDGNVNPDSFLYHDDQDAISDFNSDQNTTLGEEQNRAPIFEQIVEIYTTCVESILKLPDTNSKKTVDSRLNGLTRCLEMLHILNKVNTRHGQMVSFEKFYVHKLHELVNLQEDFNGFRNQKKSQGNSQLFLCKYPFLLDGISKSFLLRTDLAFKMDIRLKQCLTKMKIRIKQRLTNFMQMLMQCLTDPTQLNEIVMRFDLQMAIEDRDLDPMHIIFQVRSRETLFSDVTSWLEDTSLSELRKPLLVVFPDENTGAGGGGVRQEFFKTLQRQVLSQDFGLFILEKDDEQDKQHLRWFNPKASPKDFKALGQLYGLALYNDTFFDLHLPLAFYKKLMRQPVCLEDMRELQPTIVKSLQQILDYNADDFDDLFGDLTFTSLSSPHVNLVEDGDKIMLSQHNKQKYVDSYVDYVLNTSVAAQYDAFVEGFRSVCDSQILQWFRPEELKEMFAGTEDFDFEALEKNARYEGDYHANHQTIRFFWEVVHEMEDVEKRKFLKFVASVEKCTTTFMRDFVLRIIPSTPDEDGRYGLPEVHTCMQLLMLPPYESKDIMKKRLLLAICQTENFRLAR